MFASLRGTVEFLDADRCVVEVGGVGYLVQASTRTLAALPQPPEQARLLVETQVREDAISLYGFIDTAERDWFRLLLTVQGVGAKVALALLSTLSPADLVRAVAGGDRGALTRAAGVGAKLAVRLLSELRDKAGTMPSAGGGMPMAAAPVGAGSEALSALMNLGYRRGEAEAAVAKVTARLDADAAVGAVIRESLRELSPG